MTVVLSIFFFALGAVLASFAGVIAERLYTGDSWLHGRSRCNVCARELGAPDLVPIFSWMIARGRCRSCAARIPARYAVAELALGLAYLFSYLMTGLTVTLLPLLAGMFILGVIVLYDLRHMIVPPPLSFLLTLFCACYAWLAYGSDGFRAAFVMALLIAVLFLLVHFASRGRFMGLGDAPVAFALALLTGTEALSGLVYSFWIGALIGIIVLWRRPKGHRMGIEVPFVPFMAIGFLLALFTQWNVFPLLSF